MSELLPDVELEDRTLTNRALIHGRVKVSKGGSRLRKETTKALSKKEQRSRRSSSACAPSGRGGSTASTSTRSGRPTRRGPKHREFPRSSSTSSFCHSVAGGAQLDVFRAVRATGASRIGRKHYLDLGSKLLDPTPSAEAVRGLVDEALAALSQASTSPQPVHAQRDRPRRRQVSAPAVS